MKLLSELGPKYGNNAGHATVKADAEISKEWTGRKYSNNAGPGMDKADARNLFEDAGTRSTTSTGCQRSYFERAW